VHNNNYGRVAGGAGGMVNGQFADHAAAALAGGEGRGVRQDAAAAAGPATLRAGETSFFLSFLLCSSTSLFPSVLFRFWISVLGEVLKFIVK
jgi:hypothetical protein